MIWRRNELSIFHSQVTQQMISSHHLSLTSPYRYFYVTNTVRALQSHDLSGEGIKLWITRLFWPHKDMEGLPGWVISPMPRPPPRQHKHERQFTPSTHSVIPTRRRWNDDDDGQMIFGDLGGLKFPDNCLTGEEKTRKNLTQETCPDRDRIRARCVTSAHATTCSKAVATTDDHEN